MRPELINAAVLAYLGDSVFEMMVRDYLVKESGLVKLNDCLLYTSDAADE